MSEEKRSGVIAQLNVRFPNGEDLRKDVRRAAWRRDASVNEWMLAVIRTALASPDNVQLVTRKEKKQAKRAAVLQERELSRKNANWRKKVIALLREHGLDDVIIAEVIGITLPALSHFCSSAGMPRQKGIRPEILKGVKLVKAGEPIAIAAKKAGTSACAIRYHLAKRDR